MTEIFGSSNERPEKIALKKLIKKKSNKQRKFNINDQYTPTSQVRKKEQLIKTEKQREDQIFAETLSAFIKEEGKDISKENIERGREFIREKKYDDPKVIREISSKISKMFNLK